MATSPRRAPRKKRGQEAPAAAKSALDRRSIGDDRRSAPAKPSTRLRGRAREARDRELEALAGDAYLAYVLQLWLTETRRRHAAFCAYSGMSSDHWLAAFVDMVGEVATVTLPSCQASEIAAAAESRLLAMRVVSGGGAGADERADERLAFAEAWIDAMSSGEGTAAAIRALGCGPDGKAGWLGYTYEQLSQRPKLAARRSGMTVVQHRTSSRALAVRTLAALKRR